MTDLRISGASGNARNESDIRLNYGDPSKVIAASNESTAFIQAQFYSTDGGSTWNQTTLPLVAGETSQSDPAVDWTSDGTAWSITLGIDTTGTLVRLRSYQSTDNGATWTFEGTPSGTQTGTDREIMWVDHSPTSPFKDQIYAIYHNGAPAFVARRTAGATGTWQTPLQVSSAETTGTAIGGDIKTNSFGDVFAFWPDAAGSRNLLVATSTNGGAAFGTPVTIATTFASTRIIDIPAAPRATGRGARVYISAAAFRTATKDLVYAVWTDLSGATGCTTGNGPGSSTTSTCKSRIWFSRSTNGGANWSTPAMLNNQAGLNDQFHSRLCVDESNGNLIVCYHDTVNDTNRIQTDLWMQTSTDDGQSWSTAVQVTTGQTDETAAGANSFQYGDYNGLHGHYGTFFPTWTDRRNGGAEETWTAAVTIVQKRCFFIMDRCSFGQDEVQAMVQLALPNPATVSPAFYVVVEGYTAAELGITSADLTGAPGVVPTLNVSPGISGMTVGAPTRLVAQDPSLPATPQRFTWLYPISFTDASGFIAQLVNVTLTATISSLSGSALLELRQQPNPYEIDGQTSWLSTDLRVFQLKRNQSRFGATISGSAPTDASNFIKAAIANLNSGNTGGQTYENDLDPNATAIALYQTDTAGTAVFNFAIARVRYQALLQDATRVRVFFRLFPALTVSLDYDPTTTYRSWSDGVQYGQAIPLLGTQNNNILSIPCFAELRVDATTTSMTAQTDSANAQPITHNASGAEVDVYFGCWLDMNQPSQTWFPLNPPTDGPFTGTLQSVLQLVRNAHQCLVAEVSFDPDPIPTAPTRATPSTSDKLAQRNLSLVFSDNPGDVESRRIPNTFEVRPTPAKLAHAGRLDELMIDWGNTPHGSVARIYMPDASADEILELAAKRYMARHLERLDEHTLECVVGGITYLPIPAGSDINFPGLLTIDLPPDLRKGQRFKVVVRQITHAGKSTESQDTGGEVIMARSVFTELPGASMATSVQSRNMEWRRVLGAFQISIPVLTREVLLDPEERLLSVLRWILLSIPTHDRWYRVFRRYVGEIAHRVSGFGGDPGRVLPSPTGQWQEPEPHPGEGSKGEAWIHFYGKVVGLIYDRFGDFEGFVLDTEDGDRTFYSREHAIEDVARRAWTDRIAITVYAERHAPHLVARIVLRHAPRPAQH